MSQDLQYEGKSVESTSDIQMVEEIGVAYNKMRHEIHKKIVGQEEVVDNLLTSIFAGGHVLLVRPCTWISNEFSLHLT
jgi:hypothetical protein